MSSHVQTTAKTIPSNDYDDRAALATNAAAQGLQTNGQPHGWQLPPDLRVVSPEAVVTTKPWQNEGPEPFGHLGCSTYHAAQDQPDEREDLPRIKYVPQAQLDADLATLELLSQAALGGDKSAIDQLRIHLDNCPHIWRRLADLQVLAERKLIDVISGADPLRIEAFGKRCSELRHNLLDGQSSSLLVKMATSRVVMCWLFCQFLEVRILDYPEDTKCIKQLEQAERRYQVAMRTFQMARHADLQLSLLADQRR